MGVQRDVGGTGACRAQWAIQAGGTSGIARSDGTSRLCEFPGEIRIPPSSSGPSAARSLLESIKEFYWSVSESQ